MVKCKYCRKCKLYNENSNTCNKEQLKEDEESYCGEFRRFENEK